MFIDVHCHLDDPKIKDRLDECVNAFRVKGVNKVINIGCNVESSMLVKKQSDEYEEIYYAVGYHPMDISEYSEDGEKVIIELAKGKKCVAIGEIGLDYYWNKENKEFQKEKFIRQIEIAKELKLPINVHIRDALGDSLELLKQNKDKLTYGGVIHCFSGSKEIAKEMLKLGLYISFGGTSTFKNANSILEVIKMMPSDRILTETDCPYLAPEPVRGTVNEPKNIPIILEKLAFIRNEEKEILSEQVYKNAHALFTKLN